MSGVLGGFAVFWGVLPGFFWFFLLVLQWFCGVLACSGGLRGWRSWLGGLGYGVGWGLEGCLGSLGVGGGGGGCFGLSFLFRVLFGALKAIV